MAKADDEASSDDAQTHAVRFSSRLTPRNFEKLQAIAKTLGWRNAQGSPNLSKVVNWLIEQFEFKAKKKETGNGRR